MKNEWEICNSKQIKQKHRETFFEVQGKRMTKNNKGRLKSFIKIGKKHARDINANRQFLEYQIKREDVEKNWFQFMVLLLKHILDK